LAASLPYDQRGYVRPAPGKSAPDIGAVEVTPAFFLSSLTNQIATNGMAFTWRADGAGDPPLVYQWRLDGGVIAGASNSTYTIATVTTSNAGTYHVSVSNSLGGATGTPATLTVVSPPRITVGLTNVSVNQGERAEFVISATGDATLRYLWSSNRVYLPVSETNALVMASAQVTNAGPYFVIVTNVHGAVTSAVVQLRVFGPATIGGVMTGTNFAVLIPSQTGMVYVTEMVRNLSTTNWVPVATNGGTGLVMTNLMPRSTTTNSFYRVRTRW
jgi:hypothetical protein